MAVYSGFWQGEREGDLPLAAAAKFDFRIGAGGGLAGFSRRLIVTDAALAVFESEAVTVHLKDMNVMGKAIEERRAARSRVAPILGVPTYSSGGERDSSGAYPNRYRVPRRQSDSPLVGLHS
jgi:hypothetical protein